MQDFTGGGIHALPSRTTRSTGDADFDRKVKELVGDWAGAEKNAGLIEELIITALKMAKDGVGLADLKLFNRSLREMRNATRVFAPYRLKQKVVVFGSARTASTEVEYQAAEVFAQKMRDLEYMIITGGGDGIMGAAQKGAGREASFGLNIRLPFEQRANETIDGDRKLINFNYFFTRKLHFVKESHAVALFPGGFGTFDELFELLTLRQTGKAPPIPVVLFDRAYWTEVINFDALARHGMIAERDLDLIGFAEDAEGVWAELLARGLRPHENID